MEDTLKAKSAEIEKVQTSGQQATVTNQEGQPSTEKLSYEQLNTVCQQLSQQNYQLKEHIKVQSENNYVQKIQFMLDAIRLRDMFSTEFITKCILEVEEVLQPKEVVSTTTQE